MSVPLVPPVGLTATNLSTGKESTYFTYVLILSILFWLVIAVTIIGAFYAIFIGFFLWLGGGLLVAYLRSEGVRVDERQLPELHATFGTVCQQLGVIPSPALYVIQAGGMLNAFATREAVGFRSDELERLGVPALGVDFQ